MSVRKLWKVTRSGAGACTYRPESQTAAYRYIQAEAANYQCSPATHSPLLSVYVDGRDGQGWQLYEEIDLRELP